MWLKRFIVALVSLAMITPSVIVAAPYTYGRPDFTAAYLKYDAKRNVFLDTAGASDNICRLMQREAHEKTGSYDHPCAQARIVPALRLVLPQTDIYNSSVTGSSSAAMRNSGGKSFKVTNVELAQIAQAAADAMASPNAFARFGLAFDARGRPTDVFKHSAVRCDALGWVYKKSCEAFGVRTKHERAVVHRVAQLLNQQVIRRTGRSMVAINDEDGREAIVGILKSIAGDLASG